jgi:hypothetical protein
MRTLYICSDDVVATVGSGKTDAGVGSGLMVNAKGETIGFDLFCEIEPGKWVHADQLPEGVLGEEKRRGSLQAGILYNGRFYNRLNVRNISDRLIAAKVGLELKAHEYRGGSTAFKAQIGDPMTQLANQIGELQRKIEELKTLESAERKAWLETLPARIKRMRKEADKLQEEEQGKEIKPEDVEPHPLDFLTDITRAYGGRMLNTTALEQLAKAQHIADYIDENNDLMLNPEKMRALRSLLLQ